MRALPPFVDAVGVFVGLKTRQVCALAYQLGLRDVQCFADIEDVEDSFPFQRIAAFRVKDRTSLDEIDRAAGAATLSVAIKHASVSLLRKTRSIMMTILWINLLSSPSSPNQGDRREAHCQKQACRLRRVDRRLVKGECIGIGVTAEACGHAVTNLDVTDIGERRTVEGAGAFGK